MIDDSRRDLSYPRLGAPFDDGARTIARLARHWAAMRPDETGFVMLGEQAEECETLTYRQLDGAATALARRIVAHAAPGERALLMFPSGLSFAIAFVACHYAGVVPVPVVPLRAKRLRDASLSVASDCAPALVLTARDYEEAACVQFSGRETLARTPVVAFDFDEIVGEIGGVPADTAVHAGSSADLAFLQYTSGSTSAPKGVAVTQDNLFANLAMQQRVFENPIGVSYVGWAPLYHDMGLIGNLLEPFYLGGRAVLMTPGTFAQSPWLWLRAIARYGARVSGGPNFAYDLCVARAERILREDIDLSCWAIAYNSAEPVRADTIRRFTELFAPLGFRAEAMRPCFGMAEATLLVSTSRSARAPIVEYVDKRALALGAAVRVDNGADRGAARPMVGCGEAVDGERIAIVDPETHVALPDGQVGEIWVHGPHVPSGYWNRPAQSRETFHATIAGEGSGQGAGDAAAPRYLRTGDLGYLRDGELFVAARLKDVLIVRGRNIYPQDLERTAELAYPGMKINSGAAFALEDDLEETAATRYVLVQEVERGARRGIDREAAALAIRQAVLREFELTLHAVVFVEPGSIPKTSSGKIRRAQTKQLYRDGALARIDAPRREAAATMEDRDVVN